MQGQPEANAASIKEPRYNHIDVKITYACNFCCEYCYQADENGVRQAGVLSKENANNLLKFIDRLGINFDVTLAGGEPFVYPYLNELAKGLAERGCGIMIITNFSASIKKLEEFLDAGRNMIKEFNISVHISQWNDMFVFYEKLEEFLELVKKVELPVKIKSRCVVTDENYGCVRDLSRNMKERFSGIEFRLQRVYYENIYHKYKPEIEEYLQNEGVDVPVNRIDDADYAGQLCWTGNRFFYIESDGTVYRCYTRQQDNTKWILGNLNDYKNIRILNGAEPCQTTDWGRCLCHEHFENVGFVQRN